MSEQLPKWPTKEQYELAWKGCERDLTKYYQDAAFAAIPRLRLAVRALNNIEVWAYPDDMLCSDTAKEALSAIGEMPE